MSDNVVCPPNLREGLFCTAAVDRPQPSFHGTSSRNKGMTAGSLVMSLMNYWQTRHCWNSQNHVQTVAATKKDVDIPKANFLIENDESQVDSQVFLQAVQKENK